jgi:hypothetical protein
MANRAVKVWMICCLLTGTMWAASAPYAGKWKLNPAESRLTDVMKVKALGGDKYELNLGGDSVEKIVVDGRDQSGSYGTTLSVTAESANRWKVERKSQGRTTIIGNWKLSEDGNTLADDFTSFNPDGTTFHLDYVYKRTASGKGFAGTWESTTQDMSAKMEFEIAPIREDGVTLDYTSFGVKKEMLFDGKLYPVVGGNAPAGSVGVARRVNERTFEVVDKVGDKLIDTQRFEVSADGQTLTVTITIKGREKPQVQVFDRL